MKRSWIGVGLLAVLLLGSLLADWGIARCHAPVSRDLAQASRSILDEDWSAASQLYRRAMDHWRSCHPFRAAMGDQGAMEEVDRLLARLKICLSTQDPESASLCAEIAQLISDLPSQGAWWDLL